MGLENVINGLKKAACVGLTTLALMGGIAKEAVAKTYSANSENNKAKIIYVDDDANGLNDGSSWVDAYSYLQDALTSVAEGYEIRVAQGVYKPDQGMGITPYDRTATFKLMNMTTIKGGYAGLNHLNPNARDINLYKTILSGDLNSNDGEIDTIRYLHNRLTRSENSYSVVNGSQTDITAVLDGVNITAGNANALSFPHDSGGGLHNYSGSPTLVNCNFIYNSGYSGGGMYNINKNSTLTNCIFEKNWALRGGGIHNENSNSTIINCTFSSNQAAYGAGVHNLNSNPIFIRNMFKQNYVWQDECGGGGMYCQENSNPIINNSVFIGNWTHTDSAGGGIISLDSKPILTNCTFTENKGWGGGAIFGSAILTNCIIWNNFPLEIFGSVTATYSNIKGGWPGQDNINIDPQFAELGYWDYGKSYEDSDDSWFGGDCHLKSQAGRWDPNNKTWKIDDVTSQCIDVGNPMSPIGEEQFPNGGIINMGAYGGTAEASKTYFGKPNCEIIVAGDINGDCRVDFTDFAIMASHWLEER